MPRRHHTKCTGYIRPMIEASERRRVLDAVCERITEEKLRFSAIAFTGLSGAMIGPPLADRLKKNLIAVRKEFDSMDHSNYKVEGIRGAQDSWDGPYKNFKYIIVDDLIGSGDTIKRVKTRIAQEIPEAVCAGVVLYTHQPWDPVAYAKMVGVPRVVGVQL